MSLTFYYSPMSSASPTHWVLEELGVPYEKVSIDLKKEEQKKPAFLKLNPMGRVPVLVHDGVAISESVAIAIYLGETFGVEKGLYPAPGPQRGLVMQWLVWCNASLGESLSRFAHNGERFPEEQRNAKAAEAARESIAKHLDVLEGALTGKSYLVEDKFTLADAHVSSWIAYVGMIGIDIKPYAAINAWIARCNARPAAARAT